MFSLFPFRFYVYWASPLPSVSFDASQRDIRASSHLCLCVPSCSQHECCCDGGGLLVSQRIILHRDLHKIQRRFISLLFQPKSPTTTTKRERKEKGECARLSLSSLSASAQMGTTTRTCREKEKKEGPVHGQDGRFAIKCRHCIGAAMSSPSHISVPINASQRESRSGRNQHTDKEEKYKCQNNAYHRKTKCKTNKQRNEHTHIK